MKEKRDGCNKEKREKERDGGHKSTYKVRGICQDISSVWRGEVSGEPVQGQAAGSSD